MPCAAGVTFKNIIYICTVHIYTIYYSSLVSLQTVFLQWKQSCRYISSPATELIVSMTLATLMQHQSGRSQCQLQNYWIRKKKKKKDLLKMISSSVHSLPNRHTFLLLTTIWIINGLKRGKVLYRFTSSMRNSLKDYLLETTNMMDKTTVFLPSSQQ